MKTNKRFLIRAVSSAKACDDKSTHEPLTAYVTHYRILKCYPRPRLKVNVLSTSESCSLEKGSVGS